MRYRLLPCLLMLAGCAWGPGEGFATLEPSVSASWVPLASREAADGYQRLSSDYQVRLEVARVRFASLELLTGASGGATFDPSRPPPGYSLCHGGHCHRDDGALVPYDEVAAQSGGTAARVVATLPVDPMDLLAPRAQAVVCEPDCALPELTLKRGRWPVLELQLEGTVRDGRAAPRLPGERRFRLSAAATGEQALAVLESELEVPSDRAHPPRVRLALGLEVTAALFDGLDWGATTVDGQGVVDMTSTTSPNAEARAALLARFALLAPQAEVSRAER